MSQYPRSPSLFGGVLHLVYESALHNQRVGLVEVKKEGLDKNFLHYLMRSPAYRHWVVSTATGSTVKHTSPGRICDFQFFLPSIFEQKKIGEILSVIDHRIEVLRETNATLGAIAQALFKSWFVDFDPVRAKAEGRQPEGMDAATAALFPGSFEESELGAIPKGWRVGMVGEIAEVIDCLHAKKPDLTQTGLPFLQLSNIRDDGLLDTSKVSLISGSDYKKWTSRLEAAEGDCVITNVGRVGAVAQVPAGFKAAMGRNMTGIRLRSTHPFPTYLIELLLSAWMRAEIAKKTDMGTILDALNVRSIPLLRCFIAPEAVFQRFEELTKPLRAAMEINLARANALASLRDVLLPRLISGQLRLPVEKEQVQEKVA